MKPSRYDHPQRDCTCIHPYIYIISHSRIYTIRYYLQGVPQFDGFVTRGGNDLTVVNGKGHGENIIGMANKATSGGASVEIPQAKGLVPGSRKHKLTVG